MIAASNTGHGEQEQRRQGRRLRRDACRLPRSFESSRSIACVAPTKRPKSGVGRCFSTWQHIGCERPFNSKRQSPRLITRHRSFRKTMHRVSHRGISMLIRCALCDDTGWVCGVHQDRPWSGALSERACPCRALGTPCEQCNPDQPRDTSGIFRATVQ